MWRGTRICPRDLWSPSITLLPLFVTVSCVGPNTRSGPAGRSPRPYLALPLAARNSVDSLIAAVCAHSHTLASTPSPLCGQSGLRRLNSPLCANPGVLWCCVVALGSLWMRSTPLFFLLSLTSMAYFFFVRVRVCVFHPGPGVQTKEGVVQGLALNRQDPGPAASTNEMQSAEGCRHIQVFSKKNIFAWRNPLWRKLFHCLCSNCSKACLFFLTLWLCNMSEEHWVREKEGWRNTTLQESTCNAVYPSNSRVLGGLEMRELLKATVRGSLCCLHPKVCYLPHQRIPSLQSLMTLLFWSRLWFHPLHRDARAPHTEWKQQWRPPHC